jgi:hypothetical protein
VPRPRFFPTLDILKPRKGEPAELSVCAMGPVESGDEILSIRVWVHQEADGQAAASAGNGGKHLGGHDFDPPSEAFPLTGDMWMVQTKLEKGSPQFIEHKPALATAMARVRRGGNVEVEQWSQVVMIGPHEGGHGEEHVEPHEEPHHPPHEERHPH